MLHQGAVASSLSGDRLALVKRPELSALYRCCIQTRKSEQLGRRALPSACLLPFIRARLLVSALGMHCTSLRCVSLDAACDRAGAWARHAHSSYVELAC